MVDLNATPETLAKCDRIIIEVQAKLQCNRKKAHEIFWHVLKRLHALKISTY